MICVAIVFLTVNPGQSLRGCLTIVIEQILNTLTGIPVITDTYFASFSTIDDPSFSVTFTMIIPDVVSEMEIVA